MNNLRRNNRALMLYLMMLLTTVLISSCVSSPAIVETSNGPIRGRVEVNGVYAFKGVRYGAAPIGELRFKPPVRPDSWEEIADAYEYGYRAMQGVSDLGTSTDLPDISEDCLFLNVWSPGLDNKKRPVMVWLHGGGFSSGSGSDPFCEGKNLARIGDVVVVTVNHRLNVFGFLQLSEKWGPDYASSGQAGMLDIVLGLEWVRDNIARFGGDPGNVTIFGESGGGRKVAMLMAMPPADNLFHKAIIQSGSGLDAPYKADAVAFGRELLNKLGIPEGDVVALENTDAQAIFDAQPSGSTTAPPPGGLTVPTGGFVPCIDGVALQRKPFIPDAPMLSADVPLLIGSNKDEMSIFRASSPEFDTQTDEDFVSYVREVLPEKAESLIPLLRSEFPDYSPSELIIAAETLKGYWIATVLQAERKAEQDSAPVYVYLLAWETKADEGRLRAHHALDVPLVFNNIEGMRAMVGPGPEPQRIADLMSAAWIAFARTGNPNTDELPPWPAYDLKNRSTMIINLNSEMQQDPYSEIRRILLENADLD
jgi:para-nitrobenzyl esterase